ncbi:hypothetical protein SAMN05216311_101267 [Chitinophaga sp. CF418]|nr:hypothetical protein SAMN05216311_101267 [Chitinophaga sp. CF418]
MGTNIAQSIQNGITNFNNDYKDTPIGVAGLAVSKSLDETTNAITAFQNGDVNGGSAALLRGIGALSGTLVLSMGPAGAAFGALLNGMLGIISVILEAIKPPTESMLSKIENLIMEETLRNTRDKITAGISSWQLLEVRIDKWVKDGRFITVDYMNQSLPDWERHYEQIDEGFNTLNSHTKPHSTEWLALFELNVVYAVHFWTYIELLNLLITNKRANAESQEASDKESREIFYGIRRRIAEKLKNRMRNIHYSSVVEVDFYSTWLSSARSQYHSGKGLSFLQANQIYHRIGALGGLSMESLENSNSNCFATASSGTIFSVERNGLYVGRKGVEWERAPLDLNGDSIEQVTIGEKKDGELLIVCILNAGKKIAFCTFDDRAGTAHEDLPNAWTPGAWRFDKWKFRSIPGNVSLLSVGVTARPAPEQWAMYTFAVDKEGAGQLYKVQVTEGDTVKMTVIKDTYLDPQRLSKDTYGVAPVEGRSEVSPCVFSFVENKILLQIGNLIFEIENEVANNWHVQEHLEMVDPQDIKDLDHLQVFQARFYEDGSMLFATNMGLILRYNDPESGEWRVYKDAAIETIWFTKAVAEQALAIRALITGMKEAADQPIEKLLGN